MKLLLCAVLVAVCGCGGLFLSKKYKRKERLFFDLNNFFVAASTPISAMKEYQLKNFWKTTKIFSERIFLSWPGVFAGRENQAAHSDILSDSQADKIEQFFRIDR